MLVVVIRQRLQRVIRSMTSEYRMLSLGAVQILLSLHGAIRVQLKVQVLVRMQVPVYARAWESDRNSSISTAAKAFQSAADSWSSAALAPQKAAAAIFAWRLVSQGYNKTFEPT